MTKARTMRAFCLVRSERADAIPYAPLDIRQDLRRLAAAFGPVQAGEWVMIAAHRSGAVRSQATGKRHALAMAQRALAVQPMQHHEGWVNPAGAALGTASHSWPRLKTLDAAGVRSTTADAFGRTSRV